MFFVKDLGDYKLLDASDGQRLEAWGKFILIRPDPQVIWKNLRRHPYWKKADASYARSEKGGGAWSENRLPESWNCRISGYEFCIKPMGFKHTGVFPEQATNWEWMARLIAERTAAGKPVKVLNLFGYTGGATVACAKAGAATCHVDAAKNMVNLARENMKNNGLENAPCRYIVDDCMKFIAREARRGNRYDGILMDPPSYGRGPKGETWRLEDGVHELIAESAKLLSDEPLFFLVNSYTTGLSGGAVSYLVEEEVSSRFGGVVRSEEVGLFVEQTGRVLPCGYATRWEKE